MNHRNIRHHDDMLGTIMTGLTGANQWQVADIGNTLYPIQWLRNNSADFFCTHIQSPNWRKQEVNLDSIHIHYMLKTSYTGNQTLIFDVYWAWIKPNTVFPSNIADWNSSLGVILTPSPTNLSAYYTDIYSLVTNVAPPSPDGYGTGLAVRIVRGNGTYSGDCAIWWTDAHAVKDRYGSLNEYTDS